MDIWFSKNRALFLEELFSFLRLKSISARDPSCRDEIFSCAKWLSNYLTKIGLDGELLATESYPIVFAKTKKIMEGKPTILLYGHYDVQPVDPLQEWKNNPFDPKIIDDEIFARGAVDNKGQIFYAIPAVRYLLEKLDELPFNIKFCIEGEEESSSRGLTKSLKKYKDKLAADYLLVVDFGMVDENIPALTMGARGNTTMTVEFVGSNIDFHSGEFGGIAYNPIRACIETLSKLWDEMGRVAVPGFYDDVKQVDRSAIQVPFDKDKYVKKFGIKAFYSEEGYSQLESAWLRPTVEICGIGGGYFDQGFKSVIPKKVICKLSARLVNDQDPEKIANLIKAFLQKQTKKGIDLEIEVYEGGKAITGSREGKLTSALKEAMEEVFERPCQYIYCGGSIPVISSMIDTLKAEPTMMGVGLTTDNLHAPNEHFSFKKIEKGIYVYSKSFGVIWENISVDAFKNKHDFKF